MAIISSHLLYRFANFKQWRRAAKLCRHGIHVSIIKLSTPLIFLFISSETINTLNWQKTLKKKLSQRSKRLSIGIRQCNRNRNNRLTRHYNPGIILTCVCLPISRLDSSLRSIDYLTIHRLRQEVS